MNPINAQQLVVKASELETLDETVEAARHVKLSFKLRPPPRIQIIRWMNGFLETPVDNKGLVTIVLKQKNLSRYCPKHRKDTSKQAEVCNN